MAPPLEANEPMTPPPTYESVKVLEKSQLLFTSQTTTSSTNIIITNNNNNNNKSNSSNTKSSKKSKRRESLLPLGERHAAVLRQQLMVFLGNSGVLGSGMVVSMPSVTLNQLQDQTQDFWLNKSEASWFGKLSSLMVDSIHRHP